MVAITKLEFLSSHLPPLPSYQSVSSCPCSSRAILLITVGSKTAHIHAHSINTDQHTLILSLNLTLFPLHVPVRYVTVTFIRVIAIRFLRHAFLVHSGLASSRDSQFYSLYFQSAILWDYRAMNFDWMTTKALTSRTY